MSKYVRLFFDRKKKATESTQGAVEIVVCMQRERTYINTGVCLFKNQWKENQVVNHPRQVPLNEDLEKQFSKYEKIIIAMEVNGDDLTIPNFKGYLTHEGGNRRNFMAWLKERIEHRVMRDGTRKGHNTTYNALCRFGRFRTFDDVTIENIHAFDLFIKEEKTFTKQGNPISRKQVAVHNYHKHFKSYVNEAYRLGLLKENAYDRFIDKRGEGGKRPHLTKEQVKQLMDMRAASTDPNVNRYLDFFLFQVFTGMAYADAKSFDYTQHVIEMDGQEYIDGKRVKTGGEFVVPILPYTRAILERIDYKLHIASNQKYNQFLKGIGLALGCNYSLTTHVARHTFACTIILGEGIPKEVLQVMMGHSSIRTTEIYAKLPMEFVRRSIGSQLNHIWQ